MTSQQQKPTVTDVTSQWEPRTRGGYEVLRVHKISPVDITTDPLVVYYIDKGCVEVTCVHICGRFCKSKENARDLLPRQNPSPFDGLPRDHWWRPGPLNSSCQFREVDAADTKRTVRFRGDWLSLDDLRQWQHSPDPFSPDVDWEIGWNPQ